MRFLRAFKFSFLQNPRLVLFKFSAAGFGQGGTYVTLVWALSVMPAGHRVVILVWDIFTQGNLPVPLARCREHSRTQMPLELWPF